MRHRLSAAVDGGPSNLTFTIEPLGDDRYRFVRGDQTIELQARGLVFDDRRTLRFKGADSTSSAVMRSISSGSGSGSSSPSTVR